MVISSCFVRRSHTNFQPERISIAALFEELRQIPHARPKSEGERTGTPDILTIRRHLFDRHSCIRVQSSSVNRQAWFIFIGPDWRATISESYITYLHFDDKVSTAPPALSRHKNLWAGFVCFHFIGFMFHTAFWVGPKKLISHQLTPAEQFLTPVAFTDTITANDEWRLRPVRGKVSVNDVLPFLNPFTPELKKSILPTF